MCLSVLETAKHCLSWALPLRILSNLWCSDSIEPQPVIIHIVISKRLHSIEHFHLHSYLYPAADTSFALTLAMQSKHSSGQTILLVRWWTTVSLSKCKQFEWTCISWNTGLVKPPPNYPFSSFRLRYWPVRSEVYNGVNMKDIAISFS